MIMASRNQPRPVSCRPGKSFPGGKEATVISIVITIYRDSHHGYGYYPHQAEVSDLQSRISGSDPFSVYAPHLYLAIPQRST
jgi:hypothetical protein